MNLSGIKRVAFIENFDAKKSYPQFNSIKAVEPKVEFTPSIKEDKVLPKWKKNQIKAIKKAKRAFKARVGINYKPTLLVSTDV